MSNNLIDDEPIDAIYKSSHLFLLVGKNPLPNLVAAQLLANDGATVYLLYSDGQDGEPSTQEAANKLHNVLGEKRSDLTIKPEAIPSSKKWDIVTRLEQIIGDAKPDGQIGLNYTGATKPMSVHTYRTIDQCLEEYTPTFSYLDPRKIALHIDGQREPVSYSILRNPHLRPLVELSLEEITALHGYTPDQNPEEKKPEWPLAAETPGLFELCKAIAELYSNKSRLNNWQNWIQETKCITLPDPELGLDGVLQAMDNLCKGTATAEQMTKILKPDATKGLTSCSNWFIGRWLEEYTAVCFQTAAQQSQLKSFGQNLYYRLSDQTTESDNFELDMAGVFGYQLFAVSCINSDGQNIYKKAGIKKHFLEIFVRAKQLGGDEARFALVCLYSNPELIEREVARKWDARGRIKVFGAREVGNLTDNFQQWFTTENQ